MLHQPKGLTNDSKFMEGHCWNHWSGYERIYKEVEKLGGKKIYPLKIYTVYTGSLPDLQEVDWGQGCISLLSLRQSMITYIVFNI